MKIAEIAHFWGATLLLVKSHVSIVKNFGRATFSAIFSQTHLVTLAPS
jgi:hypothetical protein